MSPILEQQRRLHEVGRIRIGEKVPTSGGRSRPSKLSAFRFTSGVLRALESVAGVYGGEVRPWEDAPDPGQFELYTEATELDVIVPPEEIGLTQWYELWSGAGCKRRCDGQREVIGDRACVCDPDKRECKKTTRLSLMLRAVPGVGLWRLETHGGRAAEYLAGSFDMAAILREAVGRSVLPGKLALLHKSALVAAPTRNDPDKMQTARFVVPVLDFAVDMAALALGGSPIAPPAVEGSTAAPALGPGPVAPGPGPVSPVPSGAPPSVTDQASASPPGRRGGRQAATLPSTGLRPRAREDLAGGEAPRDSGRSGENGATGSATQDEGATPAAASGKGPDTDEGHGRDPNRPDAPRWFGGRIDAILRAQRNDIALRLEHELREEFGPHGDRTGEQWLASLEWVEKAVAAPTEPPGDAPEPRHGEQASRPAAAEPPEDAPRWCRDLHVRASKLSLDADQVHAIVAYITNDRTTSTKDLKLREASQVNDVLTGYEAGEIQLQQAAGGWEVVFP